MIVRQKEDGICQVWYFISMECKNNRTKIIASTKKKWIRVASSVLGAKNFSLADPSDSTIEIKTWLKIDISKIFKDNIVNR